MFGFAVADGQVDGRELDSGGSDHGLDRDEVAYVWSIDGVLVSTGSTWDMCVGPL